MAKYENEKAENSELLHLIPRKIAPIKSYLLIQWIF